MEKPKSKNKFLKFLPRAVSAVKFQNPPFSAENKLKPPALKGFSGPLLSIIPAEARRNPKNSTTTFEDQEPTSPKVSCMGQIKHKKKIYKDSKPVSAPIKEKKNAAALKKALSSGPRPQGRTSDASFYKSGLLDRAPSLSLMMRFRSGRETVRDFDWGVDVKVPDEEGVGDYCSDEEREGEKREGFISFSAPILVGGVAMEPRKEINLWKRRTMARPSPLQVNSTLVRS